MHLEIIFRGVAQSGSVSAWGAGGRWFESSHPDQTKKTTQAPRNAGRFFYGNASGESSLSDEAFHKKTTQGVVVLFFLVEYLPTLDQRS